MVLEEKKGILVLTLNEVKNEIPHIRSGWQSKGRKANRCARGRLGRLGAFFLSSRTTEGRRDLDFDYGLLQERDPSAMEPTSGWQTGGEILPLRGRDRFAQDDKAKAGRQTAAPGEGWAALGPFFCHPERPKGGGISTMIMGCFKSEIPRPLGRPRDDKVLW